LSKTLIQIHIVLQAVAPIFVLAIGGLFMRRYSILTAEADSSLLKLSINVLSPCLAFDSIVGNKAIHNASNLIIAPIVGYSTIAIGVMLALITCRLLKLNNNKLKGTFALTVAIYNYGYVPLPLALYLFNKETAGVLFIHNLGVDMALWTIGVALLTESRKRFSLRNIINVPLVSIIFAVLLNFMGADRWIPKFLSISINMLGNCSIPIGVILIGATIDDYLEEFKPNDGKIIIISSSLLRLLILPLIFLLIGYVLPCPKELKAVIMLQAAMPSAVFPIILTKHYGGDVKTALRVIISTSILGLITIPLWIQAGAKLFALSR